MSFLLVVEFILFFRLIIMENILFSHPDLQVFSFLFVKLVRLHHNNIFWVFKRAMKCYYYEWTKITKKVCDSV